MFSWLIKEKDSTTMWLLFEIKIVKGYNMIKKRKKQTGKRAHEDVAGAMHKFKQSGIESGKSAKRLVSKKQAIEIGLDEGAEGTDNLQKKK